MALAMTQSSSLSCSSSTDIDKTSAKDSAIFGSKFEIDRTQFQFCDSFKHRRKTIVRSMFSSVSASVILGIVGGKPKTSDAEDVSDQFNKLKHRFLGFRNDKYFCRKNLEHYQRLSQAQAPKFMVIACADSRVCPSSILGFEPGEAFVVRNVANLVPPSENGPSETNAALEFAVNSLEVENILVVGHSRCGGIRALMGYEDDKLISSSFITSWVSIATPAKSKTKASASNLDFDLQCTYCEKESVNRSMLNLLSYPWIKERVTDDKLSIHGGYYDFTNCSFEKWSLDHKISSSTTIETKNREIWT